MGESLDLIRAGPEEIEGSDLGQITQDFEPIVDKMSNAKLLANSGLFMSLTTEMNMVASDSGLLIETMVLKPAQGFVLNFLTAFRYQMRTVSESISYELSQDGECIRHCRGLEIIVRKERGIRIIVYGIDYDASDVNS